MSGESIGYRVSFAGARNHYLEVQARYPVPAGGEPVEVVMAVWTPGSYLVREYSRHVEGVTAANRRGELLAVEKTAKNRWRVEAGGLSCVQVEYRVYCREMTVRTNWVEEAFAVLNGAPTFLTLAGRPGWTHDVLLVLPDRWQHSVTGLPAHPDGRPHHYRAPSYDVLVDSPILLGNPVLHEFEVDGKPHTLANLEEDSCWDGVRSARDVRRIVEAHRLFWGELPYQRYVFLNLLVEGSGGLEHRNSALMMASRWSSSIPEQYKRWLGLVSHEFFHTWNVKRLRPVELGPFDYEREVYTRSLWIAEGLTSYYDDLLLARAGLLTREDYLEALSRQIQTLQKTPGRQIRSLEEDSFDAWIKHYRPDENSMNSSASYYTRGAVVGFLLDAEIRRLSGGSRSLDDVMRTACRRYAGERGYSPQEFRSTASEVAGADLTHWFLHALEGTGDLEYDGALALYGLEFKEEPAASADRPAAWLGVEAEPGKDPLFLRQVIRGTPLFEAGLSAGDEIVALDGFRLDAATWQERLQAYEPGERVDLLIARRRKLATVSVVLGRRPVQGWRLGVRDQADENQKHQLDAWLGERPAGSPPTGP